LKAAEWLLIAVLIGIVGAIVLPPVIFINRLVETWTTEYTAQLLGGFLGICGGGLVIVAVLIGAGLFARLAGWKAPQQTVEPRLPYYQHPSIIDRQSQELPTRRIESYQPPPWGATGGGTYELLPPSLQDRRFSLDAKTVDEIQRKWQKRSSDQRD
jgi:hypothetical protein